MISEVDRFIQDPEGMRLYQQERLILEVSELIDAARRQKGLKRMSLAKALKCTRGRITQILNGNENLTLRTIADALTATGKMLCIQVKDIVPTEKTWEFSFPDLKYALQTGSTPWMSDSNGGDQVSSEPLDLAA